jgi:uncharacterized membrane-anchored protein YjiN (DUF445 family)
LNFNTIRKEAKLIFRQIMALSLLPAGDIKKQYKRLLVTVNRLHDTQMRRKLRAFLETYIRKFWLEKIGPQRMSVYGLPHKSNNACEVSSIA